MYHNIIFLNSVDYSTYKTKNKRPISYLDLSHKIVRISLSPHPASPRYNNYNIYVFFIFLFAVATYKYIDEIDLKVFICSKPII